LLLGRSASGSVVHIASGGIERHRALCGARIAVYVPDAASCPRCIEKAAAYGLGEELSPANRTGR
jgi:hypothetical protein